MQMSMGYAPVRGVNIMKNRGNISQMRSEVKQINPRFLYIYDMRSIEGGGVHTNILNSRL